MAKAREEDQYAELRKQHPKLNPLFSFANKLFKESDRGVVLIASGYLEEMLKTLLANFMVEHEDVAKLFKGGNAALGPFSARIKVAFALGLLSEKERKKLDIIRDIRNDFAHNPEIGFDTDSVRSRVNNLTNKKADPSKKDDFKHSFTAEAINMMLTLGVRMDSVEKERRKEWSKVTDLFAEAKKK